MPDSDENKDKDGFFEGRTYLYIRTHPSDNGEEPLANGLPFWVSPDISIVKSNGQVGGDVDIGQINQVRVTVTNAGGIIATDAFVDVFIANPSTAFSPQIATLIGADYLTIQPYSTGEVLFAWVPPLGTPSHMCLLARVSLVIPPDSYSNASIFDVIGDRHIAQRNIHVISVARNEESKSFAFQITNPDVKAGVFLVKARQVMTQYVRNILQSMGFCDIQNLDETPLLNLNLKLGERLNHFDTSLLSYTQNITSMGLLDTPVIDASDKCLKLEMQPGEVYSSVITIQRNSNALPGEVQLIEISQESIEDGKVVGGLWIIFKYV